MEKKRILVINGHPYNKSLSTAISREYEAGASEGRHDVKLVNIRNLRFDLVLRAGYREKQRLEEGLRRQQELIKWCDHLVIVTPIWWMSVPALLKGYFDRVLLPGFAFNYQNGRLFPQRHLTGRSVRVIYTQGSPRWVMRFFLRDSFWKGFSRGVLLFCGFFPIKRTVFGKAPFATKKKRQRWLKQVRRLGIKGK